MHLSILFLFSFTKIMTSSSKTIVRPSQQQDIRWFARQIAKSLQVSTCAESIDSTLIYLNMTRSSEPHDMFIELYDLFENVLEEEIKNSKETEETEAFFTDKFNCLNLTRMLEQYFSRLPPDPELEILAKFINYKPTNLHNFVPKSEYGRIGYIAEMTPPSYKNVDPVIVIETIVLEGSNRDLLWKRKRTNFARQQILKLICSNIDDVVKVSTIDLRGYTKFVFMKVFDNENDRRVLKLVNGKPTEDEREDRPIEELMEEFKDVEIEKGASKNRKKKKKAKKSKNVGSSQSNESNAMMFLENALRAYIKKRNSKHQAATKVQSNIRGMQHRKKRDYNIAEKIAEGEPISQKSIEESIRQKINKKKIDNTTQELIDEVVDLEIKKIVKDMQQRLNDEDDVITEDMINKVVDSEVRKIVEYVQMQENLKKLKNTNNILAEFKTIVIEYGGETLYFRVSPFCEVYKIYSVDKNKAIQEILNASKNRMQELFSIQDF